MDNASTVIWQHQLTLPAKPRGFHQIDGEINQLFVNMPYINFGVLHLFLKHTSASLVITENCCTDVKRDLELFYNQIAPDSVERYYHNMEGPDDMPAHIKSSILGVSLTIPIENGQLALGRWQGIYLGEHRDRATSRTIVLSAYGQSAT